MEPAAVTERLGTALGSATKRTREYAKESQLAGARLLNRLTHIEAKVGHLAAAAVNDSDLYDLLMEDLRHFDESLLDLKLHGSARSLALCEVRLERLDALLATVVASGSEEASDTHHVGVSSQKYRAAASISQWPPASWREIGSFVVGLTLSATFMFLAWRSVEWSRGNRGLDVEMYLGRAVVCAIGLAASAWFLNAARKQSLRRREAIRIREQLQTLEPYLAPLPFEEQALLRGAMLQRLFPRLLEDDDPLREHSWPDTAALLATIKLSRSARSTEEGAKGLD